MIDSASVSAAVSVIAIVTASYYARIQTGLQKEAAEARQVERMEAEAHEVDGAIAVINAVVSAPLVDCTGVTGGRPCQAIARWGARPGPNATSELGAAHNRLCPDRVHNRGARELWP